MRPIILSLDEGTTSARAILYDENLNPITTGQREFTQIYPEPGWVEHNPLELWQAQLNAVKDALNAANLETSSISCIGITNQRETTLVWDKKTGKPIYNAVVWQCRRTSDTVEKIRNQYSSMIKEKTGLIPDSYFSAPKIQWILDNVEGARRRAESGELLFGTIDSYLIYRLTGGKIHATDPSNASRTLLYNIKNCEWDAELLEIFNIPESMLPTVLDSSGLFGYTDPEIFGEKTPITGCAGDQQAALFGHKAVEPGDFKCTYGTGNFLLMNTGDQLVESENLLTTIAWSLNGKTVYALEGSVFTTGAAVQWLRDGLGIIDSANETEELAASITDNGGVYIVPAFTGLGAPHWDQYARGTITGLTRGVGRAHIVRAVLESIAYQTMDLVEAMQNDSGFTVKTLRVDGGATQNTFLMQFQADILGTPVYRGKNIEATARGAAMLAGLGSGVLNSVDGLKDADEGRLFQPRMSEEERTRLKKGWRTALDKTLSR
ncbi:MAG: glycerol kinase GlpK [Candidatus Bathyarchaeota archaeon]|nr:glycerol kinase GlpK [Candidatus Bathyarchaeota archaeon]